MNDLIAEPWDVDDDDPAEFETGQVLDERFEIRSVLGEGGMGTVYRAYDRTLEHEVAVKVLIPRYRQRPERVSRFVQEGELSRRAQGIPGLVEHLGVGRLRSPANCPYIVYGLARGRTFMPSLHGAMAPSVAAVYARLLAEAIRGLHRVGVVHRDVTIRNIFIGDEDGEQTLTLIDLSHAALSSPQTDTRLTRVHEVPGTPGFMSPEQARSQPADPSMDVYAFGVVLYVMLTGRYPFASLARMAFIEKQASEALPFPRINLDAHPGIPEPLAQLVEDCTALSPERIGMNSVVERLDRLIAGMVVPLPVESTDVVPAAAVLSIEAAAVPSVKLAVVDPISTELDSPAADTEQVRVDPPATGARRLMVACVVLFIAAVVAAATWQAWPNEKATPRVTPGFSSAAHALATASIPPKTRKPAAKEGEPSTDTAPSRLPVEAAPPPGPADPPSAEAKKRPLPETSPRPRRPRYETEACKAAVKNAMNASRTSSWATVLRLTSKRACWKDTSARLRIRLKALMEQGRFEQCASEGSGSTDAYVRRWAKICRKRAGAGGTP